MTNKDFKKSIEGVVIEALPSTTFKVMIADEKEIVVYLSGKMRLHRIKVLPGDRVLIELSPDGAKGRIIRRI
ncbi:MAG: translation initiation factor IF-1 [Patescibacteria group bacterium]